MVKKNLPIPWKFKALKSFTVSYLNKSVTTKKKKSAHKHVLILPWAFSLIPSEHAGYVEIWGKPFSIFSLKPFHLLKTVRFHRTNLYLASLKQLASIRGKKCMYVKIHSREAAVFRQVMVFTETYSILQNSNSFPDQSFLSSILKRTSRRTVNKIFFI